MELGLSTSVLGLRAVPDGLAAFAAHGVPWVEIHGYEREEFDFSDRALVAATKRTLARHGLRLWAVHSPAYAPLDLASSDADVRGRTCAAMREAMGVSVELGARVFVCDGARPHADDTPAQADARRRFYADSLRTLFDEGSASGLRFVIENTPRGAASPAKRRRWRVGSGPAWSRSTPTTTTANGIATGSRPPAESLGGRSWTACAASATAAPS